MPNTLNYKNYRSNPQRSQNGRPTSGHCVECGTVTSVDRGGKRVTIPSQKNGVWVCANHRGRNNLKDYHDENTIRVGKGNADGISISVELESMGKSTAARAYFVKNNFLPTYDSSVDIEYKSPIYTSELPLAKIVGAIEYMNDKSSYDFSVNNEDCGIHTHYGFIDNRFDFTTLCTHYEQLFKPLNDTIKDMNENDRIAVFGRDFEYYNKQLNFNYPSQHENWINIQHRYTLEIRMPRFTSASQYMRFLKCFKKIFKTLNTHYLEHGCSERAAIKAGKKMAMVFKREYCEYFPNVVTRRNRNVIANDSERMNPNDIIMNSDVANRVLREINTAPFECYQELTTIIPSSANVVYDAATGNLYIDRTAIDRTA